MSALTQEQLQFIRELCELNLRTTGRPKYKVIAREVGCTAEQARWTWRVHRAQHEQGTEHEEEVR